jgi:hypothetical protein
MITWQNVNGKQSGISFSAKKMDKQFFSMNLSKNMNSRAGFEKVGQSLDFRSDFFEKNFDWRGSYILPLARRT